MTLLPFKTQEQSTVIHKGLPWILVQPRSLMSSLSSSALVCLVPLGLPMTAEAHSASGGSGSMYLSPRSPPTFLQARVVPNGNVRYPSIASRGYPTSWPAPHVHSRI